LRTLRRYRYVYRIWNRKRYEKFKYYKKNYIYPRYLRNFYIVIKKKNYIKYIRKAMKGKIIRGYVSTYLGYLEARIMVVVYRLNIINNIFIIKMMVNMGVININFIEKKTYKYKGRIRWYNKYKKRMKKKIFFLIVYINKRKVLKK